MVLKALSTGKLYFQATWYKIHLNFLQIETFLQSKDLMVYNGLFTEIGNMLNCFLFAILPN